MLIHTEQAASFSYEFSFDNQSLIYRYTKHFDKELKTEELIIDGKRIYQCDFEKNKFEFENLEYIHAETANIDRYLQAMQVDYEDEMQESKLPFLRWIISNVALDNDSILIKLSSYVRRMRMFTVGNGLRRTPRIINDVFFELLEEERQLRDLESFLNEMGIACKLVLKKLPDGQRELYFLHDKLVPFYDNASSGTLTLVDLYKKLIPKGVEPSLLYLDEFDAFYHYEMAEKSDKIF